MTSPSDWRPPGYGQRQPGYGESPRTQQPTGQQPERSQPASSPYPPQQQPQQFVVTEKARGCRRRLGCGCMTIFVVGACIGGVSFGGKWAIDTIFYGDSYTQGMAQVDTFAMDKYTPPGATNIRPNNQVAISENILDFGPAKTIDQSKPDHLTRKTVPIGVGLDPFGRLIPVEMNLQTFAWQRSKRFVFLEVDPTTKDIYGPKGNPKRGWDAVAARTDGKEFALFALKGNGQIHEFGTPGQTVRFCSVKSADRKDVAIQTVGGSDKSECEKIEVAWHSGFDVPNDRVNAQSELSERITYTGRDTYDEGRDLPDFEL